MNITSKQRAQLKSLAMTEDAILQLGKTGVTPEFTAMLDEALEARELVKINVQKGYEETSLREAADILSERTGAVTVQVIGRKIVFYRPGKGDKKKIRLG